MFGIKLKKRMETADSEKENALAPLTDESTETISAAVSVTEENFETKDEKAFDSALTADGGRDVFVADKDEKKGKAKRSFTDFSRLADIMGKDESAVVEECVLFQIRNIMSRLSKAVVRYGMEGGEMKTLVSDAVKSGIGGIAASPAYLEDLAKALGDNENIKVCAVVDFPFGESSFKVKYSEIKNSVKAGVDGVLTVLNTAELKKENAKRLKKELKKIGKFRNIETGVAVNAEDALSEDIKQALKVAEKSGIKYAAFLFGNVTETELTVKIKEIKERGYKIPVKIMANVVDVHGVKTLFALGIDGIITPFATEIAKELFKGFGIKSLKLG